MINRDLVQLLKYEAKKKPHIAELMANVHSMSMADIDAAQVPLPWFKQALKKYKTDEYVKQLASTMTYQDVDAPDIIGDIYRCDEESTFVGAGRWSLEIKRNDFIFVSDKIWFENTILNHLPRECTKVIQGKTRAEYLDLYNEYKCKLTPSDKPTYTIKKW